MLAVQELLSGQLNHYTLTLPHHAGALKNTLHELGVIESESFDELGHQILGVQLSPAKLTQLLGQYALDPKQVLPPNEAASLEPALEPFEAILKQNTDNPTHQI